MRITLAFALLILLYGCTGYDFPHRASQDTLAGKPASESRIENTQGRKNKPRTATKIAPESRMALALNTCHKDATPQAGGADCAQRQQFAQCTNPWLPGPCSP